MDTLRIPTDHGVFEALAAGHDAAPPVLCLHGFPDHPPTFVPLMERLARAGYRAVTPWMRGYAPSVLAGPYHMEQLAQDVIALARALAPDAPVHVVGHDWGAVAVCAAAMRWPKALASAVIMAVPHPAALVRNLPHEPAQLARSWYMGLMQLPGVAERALAHRDFALVGWLWRRWSPGFTLPAAEDRALRDCLRASMPAPIEYYRALRRMPGGLGAALCDSESRPITVPTLHLHGARDGCIAPALGRGQTRYFAGRFASEVLPGVGHFLHIEAPSLVAERVVSWLELHRGAPRARDHT